MALDTRSLKRSTNRWSRILHVYSSMVALLVVLFFGVTGITLNHPTWSIGDAVTRTTVSGTLPFPVTRDGAVDYLAISEYVRATHGVTGSVDSYEANATEGSIGYRKPGYAADLFFTISDGSYQLVVDQQGFLGVINDLHKGRNAGSSWKWLIDVSGLLLVVIAFTGMVMQLFLRRRRRSAFILSGVGAVLMILLIWITLS